MRFRLNVLVVGVLAGMLQVAQVAGAASPPAACPAEVANGQLPIIFDGYKGCNPIGNYYDALRSARPDWAPVHRCAVQDGNDAVLMMLYANGYGVPRDIDRAITHACRVDSARAEIEGRLDHLQRIKAGQDKKLFDVCDDITSGLMGGFCANIAEDGKGMQRGDAIGRLAGTFTPVQRTRFAALRKATDAFARSVGENETDLSGTGRAALSIGAQAAVQDALLADLRAAEAGKLPAGTAAGFAAADRVLNDVWRKVMALPADAEGRVAYTTVTKPDIRTTQRAWIAYRDAWSAFAQARYPSVPAAAWATRLTERRTAQLRTWLH